MLDFFKSELFIATNNRDYYLCDMIHLKNLTFTTLFCLVVISILAFSCSRDNKSDIKDGYALQLVYADSLLASNSKEVIQLYRIIIADSSNAGMVNLGRAYYGLSSIMKYRGLYDSANCYAVRALELSEKSADSFNIVRSLIAMGNSYSQLANKSPALKYYQRGYELAVLCDMEKEQIGLMLNLGNVYKSQGNLAKAFEVTMKAALMAKNRGDVFVESTAYNNLAMLMKGQKETQQAISYGLKALALDSLTNHKPDHAIHFLNMGTYYQEMVMVDSALWFYDKAEAIFNELNDSIALIKIVFNRANLFMIQGNYALGEKEVYNVINFCSRNNLKEGLLHSYVCLADYAIKQNKPQLAINFVNKGLAEANQQQQPIMIPKFYQLGAEAYAMKGLNKEALEYVLASSRITDSLNVVSKEGEITNLRIQFETELKEKEIEILSNKFKAESKARKLQNFIIALLTILILGLIIFCTIIYFQHRSKSFAYAALQDAYRDEQLRITVEQQVDVPDAEFQEPEFEKNSTEWPDESLAKIEQLFSIEYIHLDPLLTLDKLSTQTGISRRELSSMIQQISGKGFVQHINNCRVNHAKALLSNPQMADLKIEYIGLKSGFNSRAAFYSIFKQYTGLPPGVFRQAFIETPEVVISQTKAAQNV